MIDSTSDRGLFDRYASSYGEPIYPPPPDPRDPDVHFLPMPFFELNASANVFAGKRNSEGLLFRPYVGLLANGVSAARSDFFEGTHLAVFGLRFCVDLFVHFQCLLSHPGVFQGVGDSDREEARVAWNNGPDASSLVYFGALREGEMFGPLAKHPERRMVANRLYHWAMRFVGFHELAHLALGHIHFLRETRDDANIEDNANAYRSTEFTRRKRALELHADLHALQRMAVVALIDGKRPGATSEDFALLVFEMFTAITAVFRIWSRGGSPPVPGAVESYPHPAIRFVGLIESVRTRFLDLGLETVDDDAWVKGIGASLCETALEDVALGCREPAVEWMGDWDTLSAGFRALVADFRELRLKDLLSRHAFDNYYSGANILG